MSFVSKFIFDPIKAQIARMSTSVNPDSQAKGNAALSVVGTIAGDIQTGIQSHNSPIGIINTVVGDAETALKVAIDAYVGAAVGSIPVVGGLIAPEAIGAANMALDYGTQHFLTYIAALFDHHKTVVNAPQSASS